jgi:anti-sigma factor RsiW
MHLEEAVITDYVDEAIAPNQRDRVERHLAECRECRRLVDDCREIRRVAGTLDERHPPARAWARLERAIKIEQEHLQDASGRRARGPLGDRGLRSSRSAFRQWIGFAAAAAVLVVATVAGLRYLTIAPTRPATPATAASTPASPDDAARTQASAAAVEAELRAAEEHYDKAIKGLEQIASAEQGALDANTAATLQKNLAVIDQAISESRAAVIAQPSSEPARESLLESFRSKLALLQDTVALINEMRKGNEAGAARVVSGLKQKGN